MSPMTRDSLRRQFENGLMNRAEYESLLKNMDVQEEEKPVEELKSVGFVNMGGEDIELFEETIDHRVDRQNHEKYMTELKAKAKFVGGLDANSAQMLSALYGYDLETIIDDYAKLKNQIRGEE